MAAPLVEPKIQFFDNNGVVLAGGKLQSYQPGTSTPKSTYTNQAGVTPNANPVILDSAGRANIWLSGNYRLVLSDSADNVIWVVDNVREQLTSPQTAFSLFSSTPTVTNSTTFTLPGDVTLSFPTFQRIKFTTTSTTVYSRVASAAFSAGTTTVILANSGINVGTPTGVYTGVGDVGLSIDSRHVAYETAGSTVHAELATRLSTTGGTVSGALTVSGVLTADNRVIFQDAGNVAGAATIDLNAVVGNYFEITGSGWNITSFGTPTPGLIMFFRVQGGPGTITAGANLVTIGPTPFTVPNGAMFMVIGSQVSTDFWYVVPLGADHEGNFFAHQLTTAAEYATIFAPPAKAMPPETFFNHPLAIKACQSVIVTAGVPTLQASENMNNPTDNGVGDFTLQFSPALPNAFVQIAGWAQSTGAAGGLFVSAHNTDTRTTTTARIKISSDSGALTDPATFTIIAAGALV